MKPKPFSVLNHLTVPSSSTDVSEDGPLDVAPRNLDCRGVLSVAVLVSTLSTSVTCGPLCPGRTRTSEGFTGLHGADATSTLSWMKPSPDPSESSTNPNPFSGIEPFDESVDWRAEGGSKVWLNRSRVPKARGLWVVRVQRRIRDAANDEDFDMSTLFPGRVVPDGFG